MFLSIYMLLTSSVSLCFATSCTLLALAKCAVVFLVISYYIEDITRWREDMNLMYEWQEQCLTFTREVFA